MADFRGENNPNFKDGRTTIHKLEFNSWRAMKERCDNPEYRAYNRYGGRGITYCERWKDFNNFLEDMGKRPKGCTLDRIDNDGNYCPENCRWADQKKQMHNSTRKTKAVVTAEMIERSPCSMATIYKRIRNGWSVEKALNTPPANPRAVLREKLMATHNHCPVCGKICPHKRDRFCCVEHFRMSRRADGTFARI